MAGLAEPELTGAHQQAWIERLDTEHDNLRTAMAWAAAPGGDALTGLKLAGAISATGSKDFDAAWAEGQAMTLEKALQSALGRQAA